MNVLLVTDWTVDPHAVVAAAVRRAEAGPSEFALSVPAWLHGLDWAGDPFASVPCAQRQLEAVEMLAAAAGLTVCEGAVGDPDPVTAIGDARERWPAEEVLLCAPPRRFVAGPLDVARRARRLTGLPVVRAAIAPAPQLRRHLPRRRAGHCVVEVAR